MSIARECGPAWQSASAEAHIGRAVCRSVSQLQSLSCFQPSLATTCAINHWHPIVQLQAREHVRCIEQQGQKLDLRLLRPAGSLADDWRQAGQSQVCMYPQKHTGLAMLNVLCCASPQRCREKVWHPLLCQEPAIQKAQMLCKLAYASRRRISCYVQQGTHHNCPLMVA